MRRDLSIAAIRVICRIAIGVSAGLFTAATFGANRSVLATSRHLSLRAAFDTIQSIDLRKHAVYLADDTFEGREAGSRGGRAAGVYLGQELRRHSLAGGASGGGYYQPFGERNRNILALMEGSDPKLKQEVVVVGAHYDHVGYGTKKTSLGPIGYIHNGADDNASGAAGLLEMIEAFSRLSVRPKRTILFVFWDAEEQGLLGSKHWVAHPTIALDRVRVMINMDMIGRLRKRELMVHGIRTAVGLREMITRQNQGLDLRLKYSWEIRANSDHHPFFKKNIPIIMLHTGLHDDYHRPSDDSDKLNISGMLSISRFCFLLVNELANQPALPKFRPSSRTETLKSQRHAERPAPPLPSRLGIAWSANRKDEVGIRISQVTAGSAAERAGLRAGDRIVRLDGREIRNDEAFQARVITADKALRITVQRSDEEQPRQVRVELDGQPVRVGIAWRTDNVEPGCVAISRVVPASPAAQAGLKVNDRIYRVAGQTFFNSAELHRLLTTLPSPLQLEIARDGALQTVELRIAPAVQNSSRTRPRTSL